MLPRFICMDTKKDEVTLVTLGSAVELIGNVILSIAGNDISTAFGDQKLDTATISSLAISQFNARIAKAVEGRKA